MKNFDLNQKYLENLDYDDFSKTLKAFVNKNKFIEVTDLNDAVFGDIYIMLLDKYKHVYIGASSYIRKRIPAHWRKRKEFDKLIYGNIEDSVLSIDSFGALDTTRIFCKEDKYGINYCEEKYVKEFDSKYSLNRVAGGINGEHNEELRNLKLMASIKRRNLT